MRTIGGSGFLALVLALVLSPTDVRAAETTLRVDALTFVSETTPWSAEEEQWIAEALALLPKAFKEGELRITRSAKDCFDERDADTDEDMLFDGDTREARLCAATMTDRRGLQRAIGSALIFAFDRREKWSQSDAWHGLNSWQRPLSTPLQLWTTPDNQSPAGFVAPAGQNTPRLDLTTFAARYLFADELYQENRRADDSLRCRFISQSRFLDERLAALEPGYRAPIAGLTPRCPAFEAWADLERLADIEICLAAPSTVSAASIFGHTFLRLVYRTPNGETPAQRSRTISFVVDSALPFELDPLYAPKGIFGFYQAALKEQSFLQTFREYVVKEGRSIRRWRMRLSDRERRTLMERLWTVERTGRYTYYFLQANCASMMVELFNSIRSTDAQIDFAETIGSGPLAALEGYDHALNEAGEPLLEYIPEPFLSFEEEARHASERRSEAIGRLLASHDDEALADALSAARDPDPAIRQGAYERLAELLAVEGVGDDGDVYAILHASALVELHFSTLGNIEVEEDRNIGQHRHSEVALAQLLLDARAGMRSFGGDPARELTRPGLEAQLAGSLELIAASSQEDRLDGYAGLAALIADLAPWQAERLRDHLRLIALLQSEISYDVAALRRRPTLRDELFFPDRARRLGEQDFARGYVHLIRYPFVTEIAEPLMALQRAKQRIMTARGISGLATDLRQTETETRITTEAERYERAMSHTGVDGLEVMASFTNPTQPRPGVTIGGGIYDERLGDHRRYGFSSAKELVSLRTRLRIEAPRGQPFIAASWFRIVGYRSLQATMEEVSSFWRWFGWEAHLDIRSNDRRHLDAAVDGGGGLLIPLWQRRAYADHFILAVGIGYHGLYPNQRATRRKTAQVGALPVALEYRQVLWPSGGEGHVVRARIYAEPHYDFYFMEPHIELGGEASIALTITEDLEMPWQSTFRSLHFVAELSYLRTSLGFGRTDGYDEGGLSFGLALQ